MAPTMEELKQAAFKQLKEICVPILGSDRTQQVILLQQLVQALHSIPQRAFSPALANYVFFPLSTLLQSDVAQVLEATMAVVEILVIKWRIATMEPRILQELWIMTILTLGGPLDPNKPNQKGKGKALGEETELAIIKVLVALMRPLQTSEDVSIEEDPLGDTIDWTGEEPIEKPPTIDYSLSPPIPILFHTLTTLLRIAQIPSSIASLQLTAISALHTLLEHHLTSHSSTGPSPLLATALPGTASALSRIILSVPSDSTGADQARRQSTNSIVAAFRVLEYLVISSVGDKITNELRVVEVVKGATLEELVEGAQMDSIPSQPEVSTPAPTPLTGPTLPTLAWLNHTVLHLTTLLHSLSSLVSHSSPPVRAALVTFANSVLFTCGKTFGPSRLIALEQLFALAGDSWPVVAEPASSALQKLFIESNGAYDELVVEILRSRLSGLPRILLKEEDTQVINSSRIIVNVLATSTLLDGPGPLKNIERWSGGLLRALAFERVSETGRGRNAASQAWITGSNGVENVVEEDWPLLRMKFIHEASTRKELDKLWKGFGRWSIAIGQEAEMLEHFLGIALAGEEISPSALLVLNGIMQGFGDGKMTKGRKKVIKNVVVGLLGLLERLEMDTEPAPSTTTLLEGPSDADTLLIEHRRAGISLTPTLDSLNPISTSIPNSRLSQEVLLRCLSLRALSSCGEILGSSFQPFLLQILYHILAHLSPVSHPLLREHAQRSLSLISSSTAYASPQNLVEANVDYIINSVSQRLSIARLDPAAPLVLVEMIRLVGDPIIPMVQDLVEDVFEALDDFHGYEQVTVGLWAVLDALTMVMVAGIDHSSQEKLKRIEGESDRWKKFVEWFSQREGELDPAEEVVMDDHPRAPFATTIEPEEEPPSKEEIKIPPTRPQSVSAQILSKSVYFLSHPSPFLRSRVLRLIASSVPLLTSPSLPTEPTSTREADLLPIIHRAWPFILNRINDPESYVILEACHLIEALAKDTGNFMSKRILEEVWPKFKILLRKLEKEEKLLNLGKSRFTVSYRIYFSILSSLKMIIRAVPLKEEIVWELSTILRRFLEVKLDAEIQLLAREVFFELKRVNGDIVWMTLSGIEIENGLPIYLAMEGKQFGKNVEMLL